MTDNEKKVVIALQKTWNYIAYDYLKLSESNCITREELIGVVPDYLYREKEAWDIFKEMPKDKQDYLLLMAFPNERYSL